VADTIEPIDLIARLEHHRALGRAPTAELEWLAAHGVAQSYRVGEVTTHKGQPEQWLQVVLSGHLTIRADRGAGARKIIEWRGGDVCGLMPYSRGGAPPGDTVAEAPTQTLAIHHERLAEMIRECPRVTATLVHAMLDRARHFTTSDSHDEKLASLGKLAAGLAHELNNPASAAMRAVKTLRATIADGDAAERDLDHTRLTDAERASIARVRDAALAPQPARSTLEQADREDALATWLAKHRVHGAVAGTLTDTNITVEALDQLVASIDPGALDAAIRSIAAAAAVHRLVADIDTSITRVHDLVAAVKRFTFMDRAQAAEATDIRRGIADTLAVLGTKIHDKAVVTELRVADDLPRVLAFGGELNQVWLNLLDNALDAVAPAGHVVISATHELARVVVRVIDDGGGIPPDIQGRIFDPFFTTKSVGQGTGLGLDIVRRLVQRHDGEIDVTSEPGLTEFRVSLPTAPAF
jgi:signal transduction histidine kinase